MYIEDVVDATIAGLEKEQADGESFNVGTGVATDVLTVAETLIEKYGIEVPVTVSGNYRLGDIRHNYADLTKIKTKTRFRTPVEFRQGDSAIYRLGEYPGYPERPVRRLHRRDENERTL